MIDIIWRPYYELGIEQIDTDHRQLLVTMQAIQDAIRDEDRERATQLFDRLIDETREHFEREEAMLEEAKFPQLERHRQYHAKLIEDVTRTQAICSQDNPETPPTECFDNMARFVIDDILRGDLGFKSFMEEAGYIKPTVRIPI